MPSSNRYLWLRFSRLLEVFRYETVWDSHSCSWWFSIFLCNIYMWTTITNRLMRKKALFVTCCSIPVVRFYCWLYNMEEMCVCSKSNWYFCCSFLVFTGDELVLLLLIFSICKRWQQFWHLKKYRKFSTLMAWDCKNKFCGWLERFLFYYYYLYFLNTRSFDKSLW